MNAWQELVRQALVGNISSKKLSPLLLEQLKSFGFEISKNQSSEKIILKAAAVHSKLYASAQIPTLAPKHLLSAATPELLPYCSPKREQQLRYILEHNYEEIMLEFLELLIFQQVIVSPEILPTLLAYGAKHPYLQKELVACMGNRGIWLAQFSEEWNYAQSYTTNNEDIFYYGPSDERINYIKNLHATHPELAIAKLEEVWESEGFMMKTDFIKAIEPSLCESDEAFLENALQDTRKEVRDQAASLLAFIPSSRLVERMQNLLLQLVQYDAKKNYLNVDLPASCTNAMKQDGIAPRKSFIKDHGPKANQLAQIISKIPPQWWTDIFYKNPQQLLHLAAKTEWRNVFVWGWAMAAKNFKNQEWIVACHRFYLDTFFKHNWSNFTIDFLYQDLPNELFNLLAGEYLKADNKSTLSDEHPIVTFLLAEGQKWDNAIALKVIDRIKKTIHHDAYVFHWSLKSVLKRAAFSISPNLYEKIEAGWPEQSQAWHSWQKEVDNLLSILKFRLEIETLVD